MQPSVEQVVKDLLVVGGWQCVMESDRLNPISLRDVVKTLQASKNKCVLIGGHARNYHAAESRNTHDIDLLVADPQAAHDALEKKYPQLHSHSKSDVYAALVVPNTTFRIDLLNKDKRGDWKMLWDRTEKKNGITFPTRIALIAIKYTSAFDEGRTNDGKMRDSRDFVVLVKKKQLTPEEQRVIEKMVAKRGNPLALTKLRGNLTRAKKGMPLDVPYQEEA